VDKLYTWTPPDMFHITIHYFGALSDEQLGRVLSQLGASAKPTPLQWEVDSLGMFPTRDSLALPNILWVHPHSTSPNFQKFYEDVHAACGLPSKWRGFQAHITIARLRKIEAAHRPALTALAQILGHEKKGAQPPSGEPLELATARALSLAESASKIQPPLRFTINHVALMYNGGRCYIEHATFPFAGVAS
jgi:2'-5' RNA ligase